MNKKSHISSKSVNAMCLYLLFLITLLLSAVLVQADTKFKKRWIYVPSNLYVNENIPKLDKLLTRAHNARYNGVLFTDYKMFTWWQLDDPQRWKRNAQQLRAMTRKLDMELVTCVFPFGYAGSLLWHDVNLASGMPIKKAPLIASGKYLVPVQTAQIANGSFEDYRNNTALNFSFQDMPGTGSFIDSEIKKHGSVSLRFENIGDVNPYGNGRICQQVSVLPWQQYRLSVWMKTENLDGGEIKLLVLGAGRTLQWQHLQVRQPNGQCRYVSQARNMTTDWVEQSVTFNSLDNENVNVYIGIWAGKKGKIWWDDLRIDPVPTLNILRRDTLPIQLTSEDGTVYDEGVDFEQVVDPALGNNPWPGSYDTRHEPPGTTLTDNSRIKPDQTVYLSCYHPALVYDGQINCSLSDPKVFDLCRQEVIHTEQALNPDGYFMSHDEIRCAGWEPDQVGNFNSSGDLLAYNVSQCYKILRSSAGQKPVYIWSDMFDPNHNAHDNFYFVNTNIAGSWNGLEKNITIMKWGGGKIARPGLQFFAEKGHSQMIAAFYDNDVKSDNQMWTEAMKDVPNIKGIMYTTWQNDYSKIEEFADTWWGNQ